MVRILLLAPQVLLNAHFQTLLAQRSDLAIAGIERDPAHALDCARALKPHVVMADTRDAPLDPIVWHILKEGIVPVVIVMNLAENRLRLYRSEEWQVNDTEDLEQAIRAEPLLG